MSKKTLGIALGGGGARGFAHIGILKVLEKEDIPIHFIAGTSMGAIIGGLYAKYQDAELIHRKVQEFFSNNDNDQLGLKYLTPGKSESNSVLATFTKEIAERIILNVAKSRTGILNRSKLSDALYYFTSDENIENLAIPFCAVAADLNSGEMYEYTKGSLIEAITASGAIPGFFPPLQKNGFMLTDGAVTNPVPVESLITRNLAIKLAVSVDARDLPPLKNPDIIEIQTRAQSVLGKRLTEMELEKADVAMHPDIAYAHWSEFQRYEAFIEAGEAEAVRYLPQIKKYLKGRIFGLGSYKPAPKK